MIFLNKIKNIIVSEWKFVLFLIALYILLQLPLNYYIIVGGGTSDISSRVEVSDSYKEKGSFNISYVTQLQGTIFTYFLSYIIPTWERENANLYKYDEKESIHDIDFRSDIDLLNANSTATYWAYTLAGKDCVKVSSNLYVIVTFDEFNTNLKVGDEVLKIDGNHYDTIDEYKEYLQTKDDNSIVDIDIIRNGKNKKISSSVYTYDGKKILGVGLEYISNYETNPKLDIKFKSSESGPSAGLITTLEIYNQLTKEDLTNGYKIAGTGTIESDGSIGQIGGVEYKVLGASQDNVDYFLVPDGDNYDTAKKYIKEKKLKVKLIKVSTIDDAIEKLKKINR